MEDRGEAVECGRSSRDVEAAGASLRLLDVGGVCVCPDDAGQGRYRSGRADPRAGRRRPGPDAGGDGPSRRHGRPRHLGHSRTGQSAGGKRPPAGGKRPPDAVADGGAAAGDRDDGAPPAAQRRSRSRSRLRHRPGDRRSRFGLRPFDAAGRRIARRRPQGAGGDVGRGPGRPYRRGRRPFLASAADHRHQRPHPGGGRIHPHPRHPDRRQFGPAPSQLYRRQSGDQCRRPGGDLVVGGGVPARSAGRRRRLGRRGRLSGRTVRPPSSA